MLLFADNIFKERLYYSVSRALTQYLVITCRHSVTVAQQKYNDNVARLHMLLRLWKAFIIASLCREAAMTVLVFTLRLNR